jgi:glutamate/tyrosine decarboxylase-like PLP-dependent enzyme
MSPAAAQTELTVIRWLLELFGLPASWTGALTSGATMANLCGLAAGRQWLSEQLGFDAARDGLGGHAALRVIAGSEIHQSALKALGILGLGRDAIEKVPSIDGVIDLDAFQKILARSDEPAIVVANAGEVNTGAFDPIDALAEHCARHRAGVWLHVDGAFGLYAALSPQHRSMLDGIALADSVASDGHKWLNVPYDCGFVFVRQRDVWRRAFSATAAYLNLDDGSAEWNALDYVPEMSRRFRALAAWCALRAAGRSGFEEITSRSIANAERFGSWISNSPELELVSPVRLNIVCFRVRNGADERDADALTLELTQRIQQGGKAYVTFTRWQGRAAVRAAFDNWSTRETDVSALEETVGEALAAILTGPIVPA